MCPVARWSYGERPTATFAPNLIIRQNAVFPPANAEFFIHTKKLHILL